MNQLAKVANATGEVSPATPQTVAKWAGLGKDTIRVHISAGGSDLRFGDAIQCD